MLDGTHEPVTGAGQIGLAGPAGKGKPAFELKDKLDRGEDFIILDIRYEEERKKFKRIEDGRVIHIPQSELRERIEEIPKDKEIVLVCQIGARSYDAYRVLKGYGFENVKVLEGGLAFWFW